MVHNKNRHDNETWNVTDAINISQNTFIPGSYMLAYTTESNQ